MKIIKYKVTSAFGSENIGTILEAILITRDEDSGKSLIFHPKKKRRDTSSFEICENNQYFYYSCHEDCYVNVSKMSKELRTILNKI